MKYRVAATIRRLIVALGTTVAMVTVFANSDARATEIGSDSAAVSQASSALGLQKHASIAGLAQRPDAGLISTGMICTVVTDT